MGVALNGHLTKGAYLNGNKMNGYLNGIKLGPGTPVVPTTEGTFVSGVGGSNYNIRSCLYLQEEDVIIYLAAYTDNKLRISSIESCLTSMHTYSLITTIVVVDDITKFSLLRISDDIIQIVKRGESDFSYLIKIKENGVYLSQGQWSHYYDTLNKLPSRDNVYFRTADYNGSFDIDENNVVSVRRYANTGSPVTITPINYTEDLGQARMGPGCATVFDNFIVYGVRNQSSVVVYYYKYSLEDNSNVLLGSIGGDFIMNTDPSAAITEFYYNTGSYLLSSSTSNNVAFRSIIKIDVNNNLIQEYEPEDSYCNPVLYGNKIVYSTGTNYSHGHIIGDASNFIDENPTVLNNVGDAIDFFSQRQINILRSYIGVIDGELYSLVLGTVDYTELQVGKYPLNISV